MRSKIRGLLGLGAILMTVGCPKSDWKVHGGPDACRVMCQKWGLEFTAMVGIGDQEDPRGQGATACVCQPQRLLQRAAAESGSASASASLAGPITAAQAAAAQAAAASAAAHQQIMIQQSQSTRR